MYKVLTYVQFLRASKSFVVQASIFYYWQWRHISLRTSGQWLTCHWTPRCFETIVKKLFRTKLRGIGRWRVLSRLVFGALELQLGCCGAVEYGFVRRVCKVTLTHCGLNTAQGWGIYHNCIYPLHRMFPGEARNLLFLVTSQALDEPTAGVGSVGVLKSKLTGSCRKVVKPCMPNIDAPNNEERTGHMWHRRSSCW